MSRCFLHGATETIRTSDLNLRRVALYPAELRSPAYPARLSESSLIVNLLYWAVAMGISPDLPISKLGVLGARLAKPLRAMGLTTAGELLRHLPFRYEDLSRIVALSGPSDGPVTVRARIDLIRTRRSAKRQMLLTEATIS